jgi:mRNA-degrading endonuclease RelE of RelBE toxin-antitoxin system
MNETEKFLRKITRQERDVLLALIDSLDIKAERDLLNPIKLKGSDFYRVRKGQYRIIFHLENNKAVADSVRYRNEKTYRDF